MSFKQIKLYTHQQTAVQKWIANDMQGIFAMATGTGKTFTAIECLRIFIENYAPSFAVIGCPNNPLITQWKKELSKFGLTENIVIVDSTNRKWRNHLSALLIDIHVGNKNYGIVLTTHVSLTSNDFNTILNTHLSKKINSLIIGDEVHRLGSPKQSKNMNEILKYRLGLSATPDRGIFDKSGTKKIYNYFGLCVYSFDLGDAINKTNKLTGKSFLTPFRYLPKFVELSEKEIHEYQNKTDEVASIILRSKNKEEVLDQENVKILLFERAKIIKNAINKNQKLENILEELLSDNEDLKWLLVYCTEKQIDKTIQTLKRYQLTTHRFTMKEGIKTSSKYGGISERDYLLKNFEDGHYNVLVAIKCLDEGIDIPPARYTILLASSGSEREYIQRIGRVIRRHPLKKEAIIYDVVVIPPVDFLPKQLKELESKILRSEFERYEKIVQYSVNSVEALSKLYEIKRKYQR